MKHARVGVAVAGVLLVLAGAAALLSDGRATAQGSALSRDASGWLAARRYLEQRGARVRLFDAPFESDAPLVAASPEDESDAPLEDPGADEFAPPPQQGELRETPRAFPAHRDAAPPVLVLTFPWQRVPTRGVREGLERHLRAGGTLVLAYTGERLSSGEREIVAALDLAWRDVRGEPPLHPLRWREFMAREWALRREGAPETEPSARLTPPRQAPRAPASAQAWYRGPDGQPMVFAYARSGGRVVVLPASALSNARLGHAGNADLLASLLASLGGEWLFDEYHHGLSPVVAAQDAHLQRSLDRYLIHVALVYVLALLALTRRFGPAWSEPPPIGGAAGTFLVGLGALHHRLGHHAAAGRRLLERAVELHPRLRLPDGADAPVRDGAGLLALARAVGRAQSQGGRTS